MKELKEMLEKLSNSMEEMKEVAKVTEKYPNEKDIFRLLLDKKIEDGMMKNLHNASEEQLKRLVPDCDCGQCGYYWRYYKEDVMFSHNPEPRIKNLINEIIKNKKRERKLRRITNE